MESIWAWEGYGEPLGVGEYGERLGLGWVWRTFGYGRGMSRMACGHTKSPAATNKSLASRGTLAVVKGSTVRTPASMLDLS